VSTVPPLEWLAPGRGPIAARSPLQLFAARLRGDRLALAGLAFVALIVLTALLAPLIQQVAGAPDPTLQDGAALDPVYGTPTGPSAEHLLGVDERGRDVFSRLLFGARTSLQVALVATALAVGLGVAAGLLAGYYRGWVDTLIARSIDLVLSFPILLLALGLGVACSGREGCLGGALEPGVELVVVMIVFVGWSPVARLVRGQVLSLREESFVEAAVCLGAGGRRIMLREILPNLAGPIIVMSTLLLPINVLFEAALSFLGVGIQPPDPSWGQMIADATDSFDLAWWALAFPGAALLLTVLAFNLVGDGLQDALHPRA